MTRQRLTATQVEAQNAATPQQAIDFAIAQNHFGWRIAKPSHDENQYSS
jgi:hypothetical protein